MLTRNKNFNVFLNGRSMSYLSFICIAIYSGGIYLLSLIYQCGFNDVVIFNPEILFLGHLAAGVISVLVFFSGFLLLFFVPGMIFVLNFKKSADDFPVFAGLCFIVSILISFLSITVFKILTRCCLDRINFIATITLVMCFGLILLWRRERNGEWKTIPVPISFKNGFLCIAFIVMAIIFVSVFHHKFIDARPITFNFDEKTILSIPLGSQPDDLELFGLADSLRHHLLPYWDLEYAPRFGFVFLDPPLYTFVSMLSILLFGQSYASLVLVSIGIICLIFLAILAQGKGNKFLRFIVCSLFLWVYFFPYLEETTLFIYPEHLFMLLIVLSYGFLLRRNYSVFLFVAAVAILTRFYSIFFVLLGFCSLWIFFKERRAEMLSVIYKYFFLTVLFGVFIAGVGILTGNLGVYFKVFLIENFNRLDHFSFLSRIFPQEAVFQPGFDVSRSLQFLRLCWHSTAFTLPLLLLFGKNREENFYSFIAIIYFFLVFFSTYQLPRYVLPLIPLTAIVVCSKIEKYFLRNYREIKEFFIK